MSEPRNSSTPLTLEWRPGSASIVWHHGSSTHSRELEQPPSDVAAFNDPPSVLIIEQLDPIRSRVDNALVLNTYGSERLRLRPPVIGGGSVRIFVGGR
jgi:hypothetical protein